jgi:polysaccharide deacetylase 2 family uncharacterized protein YibQ
MTLLKFLASAFVILIAGTFMWLDLSGDGTVELALKEPDGGTSARLPPPGPVVADPDLLEDGPNGQLPRIGDDGRKPWQVYRAAYKANGKRGARVAVVIVDLGLKRDMTRAAIENLPPEVTLAFSPYADNLPSLVRAARLKGHEVLLAVPMEPEGYPKNDPGEQTLLTSNTAARNLGLLKWSMSRFSGYVGIVAHEGGRFLGSPEHLRPVLGEVKARGLMFVDPSKVRTGKVDKLSTELGLPIASVTAIIDDDPAPVSVTARLNAVAAQARTDGYAVALGRPYPATIEAVKRWLASFRDRDLMAAPITAVAEGALNKTK